MNATNDSCFTSPRVLETLGKLHADAGSQNRGPRPKGPRGTPPVPDEAEFYKQMKHAYMAVPPEFGKLLYTLARSRKAKTVVEFGTSFAISTIYLAAAVRDNGGGIVHASEFIPEKATQAGQNLAEAGLDDLVKIHCGDARESFSPPPRGIDMAFLDGPKGMYLEVLRLLEPQLRPGAIVACDNTDHDGMEPFLDYLRNPANGYISASILTGTHEHNRGHEIAIHL